ncbi:hypothetical protein [Acetobacterium tundrae]|uniref:Cupin domain-containing protein n=1 Tax=Acetobacterium tundrae TaxID=132932 RepID=A0ABR6WJW6_9FIRM|nr:hypothetical protein [Acetobacterium tundrae]MBC3796573.1 hypothetical protein [Acetobacterium tundrae]
MLENTEAGRTSKYVVQELQDPQMGSKEFQEMYKRFSNRILWMDGNVVEGAFQMNTAWYFAVPDDDPVFEEHCHNSDEIIGFYSGDPNHPYDLGGELEVTIDGETRKITKSTMLFIPAGIPFFLMSLEVRYLINTTATIVVGSVLPSFFS